MKSLHPRLWDAATRLGFDAVQQGGIDALGYPASLVHEFTECRTILKHLGQPIEE